MTFLTESHWTTIGVRHHHGIALSLSSLHSASTAGCGDISTVKELLPLLKSWGFDTLQFLPLNDTGLDSSPYMALTSTLIHPVYLSLHQLDNFFKSSFRNSLWQSLQKSIASDDARFPFHKVVQVKGDLLADYLNDYQEALESLSEYQLFCQTHDEWLEPYAMYKTLKELHKGKPWWQWESDYQNYPCSLPQRLLPIKNRWKVIQFLLFKQLSDLKREANRLQILLKGDLPILQSKDSVDVWAYRELFDTSFVVGAPPDMYSKEGQKWGFPLYNWKEHETTNFSWWKKRLSYAEHFYHIYRLDHVVGFYRFFAIPPKKKPTYGSFLPIDPKQWIEQGETILQTLVPSTTMLPIGEDLGDIPDSVRSSLSTLGIPGTKVMRWERYWQKKEQPFIPLSQYSPESVSMISTHDSSTCRAWAQESPCDFDLAKTAWNISKNTDPFLGILQASHKTTSLFHINLFQEYLSFIPNLSWPCENMNRINVPGTISPMNWTLRLKPSLEELLVSSDLHNLMRSCSHQEQSFYE